MVLCMQNSDWLAPWITSLYWVPALICRFCACKPATFGPKLHVSMGPRNHLSIFCMENSLPLASELLVSMGTSTHLWFCALQNSDFWARITDLHGSQTSPVFLCMQYSVISTQNNLPLWVPTLTCVFFACKTATVMSRITSVYGSQTWPVVL